jgi:hypothetical protein
MATERDPDELRKAAEKRMPKQYRYPSARKLFEHSNTRSYAQHESLNHTLPSLRVSQNMAERMAAFGNAFELDAADTTRRLIEIGLETYERDT